ncbi:unnamed protein product [Alternaria alternata]
MSMLEDTLGFFERFAHPAKRVTVHQKYARFNDKRKHLDPGTTYLVVIQVELRGRLATYGRKMLDNKIHIIFELVWTCFWRSGRFVKQV